MAKVRIREFRKEDLPSTLDLLKESLGETNMLKRTPDLFDWKHLDNPFGRSLLLVAESGERVVGLRAFMRWTLETPGGSEIKCVRAVDTATHPDFQRQGIFRRLTLAGVESARSSGVDLIFNTPNRRSGPGYLKMGWGEVGSIGAFVFPRLSSLRSHDQGRRQIVPYIPPSAVHSDTALSPWKPDRKPIGLRTKRSRGYLEWRFIDHPTATYSVVPGVTGTTVFRSNVRQGRRELVVSELLGDVTRVELLRTVLRSKCRYAVGWFSRHSPERRMLLTSGFVSIPWVTALRLVALPLREDLPIDVFDPRSWDLSIGDLELL